VGPSTIVMAAGSKWFEPDSIFKFKRDSNPIKL
jgi:hypothetical protein